MSRATEYHQLIKDLMGLVVIGDLTVEDFAIVHSRYAKMRNAGFPFSIEFRLIMSALHKQSLNTTADADSDGSDWRLDREDSDEDGMDALDLRDPEPDPIPDGMFTKHGLLMLRKIRAGTLGQG